MSAIPTGFKCVPSDCGEELLVTLRCRRAWRYRRRDYAALDAKANRTCDVADAVGSDAGGIIEQQLRGGGT